MLILFINSIVVYNSAGNSTLMCRRAEAMKCLGIETKFINIINRNIDQTYPDFPYNIEILNTEPNNRLASIFNYIKNYKPKYICLHGNRANMLIRKLYPYCTKHKIKILEDVQGALEELIEFSNDDMISFVKSRIHYWAAKYYLIQVLKHCDAVFVVSEELSKYCKKLSKFPYQVIKISCGITETYSSETILEWRKEIRDSLHILNKTIVCCYSGVINSWGNFDETLNVWVNLDKSYQDMYFILMAKSTPELIKKVEKALPKKNYKIIYLEKTYYKKYLAACDVAFLIRENKITNYVAFPNKFSDYLNCGNLCYISNALKSPVKLLDDNGIPYIEADSDISSVIKQIQYRSENLLEYYKNTRIICQKALLYSSQFERIEYFRENKP